jgi:hypothetical protein
MERGEVAERLSDVGVVGAQRLFADGKAALVERLGLRGSGPVVQQDEVVEVPADVGMAGTQRLLGDGGARL